MKKPIIIRVLLSILGSIVIMMGVLAFHVYEVTKRKNDFRDYRQLSRIDFTSPLDTSEALTIRNQIASVKGVEAVYVNPSQKNAVFTYDNRIVSAAEVLALVRKQPAYGAKLYLVSNSEVGKGCPVVNPNSFSYKTTRFLSSIMD